jgi:hypothetical protein
MKLSIASVSSGHESTTVVWCGLFEHINFMEKYKMLMFYLRLELK